jgi:hypothetical protein
MSTLVSLAGVSARVVLHVPFGSIVAESMKWWPQSRAAGGSS